MKHEIDYGKLGLNIKKKRKEKKLTQEELAEMVDCYPSHISNIENNYTKASLNVLLAIANSLNTTIDYFLSDQYNQPILTNDEDEYIDVGKRITHFRTLKNYSVNKLANLAGVSQSYLRDIELGKKNPTVEMLSYITGH